MVIDRVLFAQECVRQGAFFGVNPHYILGVAQFRSGISDDSDADRIGPFRLTQGEWNANCKDKEFELDFSPNQIGSAGRQCVVFGLMAHHAFDAFVSSEDREPSAKELYLQQWPDAVGPTLDAALQKAFDDTRDMIAPAAEVVLDDPASVPAPLKTITEETTRPVAVDKSPGAPPWYTLATREIGVHEQDDNSGPAIARYRRLAQCGVDHDPWCAIFVNAMLASCRPPVPGTKSASSQSFRSDARFVALPGPAVGAIAVFWRGSPRSGKGHVAFYSGETANSVYVLGGNENDSVRIEPFSKSQLFGYWWPSSVAAPKIAKVNMLPRIRIAPVKVT